MFRVITSLAFRGGCLATVATPPLAPGRKYNETVLIQIGDCDHGPMTFTVLKNFGQTWDLYVSGDECQLQCASLHTFIRPGQTFTCACSIRA